MSSLFKKTAFCALSMVLAFQMAGTKLLHAESPSDVCKRTGFALLEEARSFVSENGHHLAEDSLKKFERLEREADKLIPFYCRIAPRRVLSKLEEAQEKLDRERERLELASLSPATTALEAPHLP